MQIRTLTVGDVFTVSDMLSSVSAPLFESLSGMLTSEKDAADSRAGTVETGARIARVVLDTCYHGCRDKAVLWFASLCGMGEKDFMEQDAAVVLDVIEQLIGSEQTADFFSRALRLFKRIPISRIASAGL